MSVDRDGVNVVSILGNDYTIKAPEGEKQTLMAATLGFIGLGAQQPSAEWGAMVAIGRNYVLDQWWYCAFPGAAILITAVGFNLFGDGIRDLLDPKAGGKHS